MNEPRKPIVILCTEAQAKQYGKLLQHFYQLPRIRHNWFGTLDLPTYDSLYLTQSKDVFKSVREIDVIRTLTFEEAAKDYNLAIPLTRFRFGRPRRPGEYQTPASDRSQGGRRWWNGKYWSKEYNLLSPSSARNKLAGERSPVATPKNTMFRGLMQAPIYLDSVG
jgi:hypothetical protein